METPALTRRERTRLQTLAEIKTRALDQVAEGGPAAVSLSAIAKAMGMSGPAIYRYYSARDELLAALVSAGYAGLSGAVEAATQATGRRGAPRRLADATGAYRAWALAHPNHYAMLFGVRPPGFADPAEAIASLHASMRTLLLVLGEIVGERATEARPGKLDGQLLRWAARRDDAQPLPAAVLRLGVLTWTRLHGLVSLELAGVFADMEIDAELLLQAELDQIVIAARGAATAG